MSTVRLTVAQAIVHFLSRQYVERDGEQQRFIAGVWGIFGHGNLSGIGQALEEYGGPLELRYRRPQNEQAMVHTAAAYAKHKDRLQTFACVTSIGPGATNMVTGAALATVNRLPVLLFPSDYFANRIPDPVLQQVEHPVERDVSANDAFRPVSRYFDRITRPEQLLSSLPEAFRVLTDPADTGAVTIALPEDVQTEAFDFPERFFERRVWRVRRPVPEPEAIDAAARVLRAARRPLIVAGGGVIYSGATEELAAFASEFGVPVVESQAGRGALAWDHPMNAGAVGSAGGLAANRLARDADVVLAVGTRLGDFVTASRSAFQNPDVRVIGVNVAALDAFKLSGLPVIADARRALVALRDALGEYRTSDAYRDEVSSVRREWDALVDGMREVRDAARLRQSEVLGVVNDAAGADGTVINAAGSMPGDLLKMWRSRNAKSYHVEYGYSTMGYEIPAGIGVKLADPARNVIVMIGDGSYLMMNSEIVTAVQEGVKFTVVLVDNGGFQSIHGLQRSIGSPSFGNELRYPAATGRLEGERVHVDFHKHAEAMGALAITARTADEVRAALERARTADRVTVIVVPVDPEARVPGFESWWDVPVAEVSGEASVNAARREYDAALERRRAFLPVTSAPDGER